MSETFAREPTANEDDAVERAATNEILAKLNPPMELTDEDFSVAEDIWCYRFLDEAFEGFVIVPVINSKGEFFRAFVKGGEGVPFETVEDAHWYLLGRFSGEPENSI
jgi:hypothetical protein